MKHPEPSSAVSRLSVTAIETPLFHHQKGGAVRTHEFDEWLVSAVAPFASRLEGSVVAITSKVVSLAEGRVVSRDGITKEALIRREADQFLGEIGFGVFLTIKEGLFIPSAGIDESNSEFNEYILYPVKPFESAARIRTVLKEKFKLKQVGVLLTDSHTQPLRKGVTGITLAYAGFRAVTSLVGEKDLFGRPFKMTSVNRADALSSVAVLLMGEGTKPTPLALLEGAEVQWVDEVDPTEIQMPYEDDLYRPFFVNKTL